jgi:NADPH-dependent ferric siderophore reductase
MSDAGSGKRQGRPEMPVWELTVIEAFDVTPRMRRVVFTGELDAMTYAPGQALVLAMPLPEGGTGRRDYTIRELDKSAGRLSMDFVLHGDTPSPNWARRVQAGDRMLARGPRGRTVFNPAADWHLFCGDETCLPAILHMLETIDPNTRVHVFLEIDGPDDHQPVPSAFASSVTWIHRNGQKPGPSSLLLDQLADFTPPEGRGHAYLIGETSNVRAQRHHVIGWGFSREQISSEGYWRPGRIGGHDHVDD